MILSASALSVFKDCPRCFYNEKVMGIKQPRGIFPSLPGGMDRILKGRYDFFRRQGLLPPEIARHFPGAILFKDQIQLNAWRNWRRGFRVEISDGVTLTGAIDELLDWQNGTYSIFDYKTRGSAPKEGGSEQYYGHQMDIYHLLLEDAGLPTTGEAYLGYWWPSETVRETVEEMEIGGKYSGVLFETGVVGLKTSAERARKLVDAAALCLNGPAPASGTECAYCNFVAQLRG